MSVSRTMSSVGDAGGGVSLALRRARKRFIGFTTPKKITAAMITSEMTALMKSP